MADKSAHVFINNDALCCATYYGRKLPIKSVKLMMSEFYASTVTTASKERLIIDLNAAKPDNGIRVPRRNTSDQKSKLKVDDIFFVLH